MLYKTYSFAYTLSINSIAYRPLPCFTRGTLLWILNEERGAMLLLHAYRPLPCFTRGALIAFRTLPCFTSGLPSALLYPRVSISTFRLWNVPFFLWIHALHLDSCFVIPAGTLAVNSEWRPRSNAVIAYRPFPCFTFTRGALIAYRTLSCFTRGLPSALLYPRGPTSTFRSSNVLFFLWSCAHCHVII